MEKDKLQEWVNKIVNPIFQKAIDDVPKETSKNPMSVGQGRSKEPNYIFWKPHNYRLYFKFNKTNLYITTHPQTDLLGVGSHQAKNHDSEHEFRFKDFRFVVKKQSIMVQTLRVDAYKIPLTSKGKQQLFDICYKIDKEIIYVLRNFIKTFGGQTNFEVINAHSENKSYGHKLIDMIGIKTKFHSGIIKKVYNENNIETGDPYFTANLVSNMALYDVMPELDHRLNNIEKNQIQLNNNVVPITNRLATQLELHLDVLQGIDTSFHKFNNLLSNQPNRPQMDDSKVNHILSLISIPKNILNPNIQELISHLTKEEKELLSDKLFIF